jgi:urea transport system permease protein
MKNIQFLERSGYSDGMIILIIIDVALFVFFLLFPLAANEFRLQIMAKCLSYIVFAYSLDLLWGYVGLMSMGHAVFFGIGAYILALGYSMENGVPTFMTSLGFYEAPGIYYLLANKVAAFFAGLTVCGVVAGILGAFLFSKKVNSVFFALITFALARVFELLINNQQRYTGGANGLTKISRKLLFDVEIPQTTYYFIMLGIVLLVYLFCRWLTNSKFGLILEALRENEERMSFFGYDVLKFKIVIWVVSAMLAGLAGMMFATSQSFIGPSNVGIGASTAVIVWLALGGRGSVTGATVGTLLVCWAESLFSEYLSFYWYIIYGMMILLVVFFIPKGVVGQLKDEIYNRGAAKELSNNKQNASESEG